MSMPVTMKVSYGELTADQGGKAWLLVRFESPTGIFDVFFEPEAAIATAERIAGEARKIQKKRLIVPDLNVRKLFEDNGGPRHEN